MQLIWNWVQWQGLTTKSSYNNFYFSIALISSRRKLLWLEIPTRMRIYDVVGRAHKIYLHQWVKNIATDYKNINHTYTSLHVSRVCIHRWNDDKCITVTPCYERVWYSRIFIAETMHITHISGHAMYAIKTFVLNMFAKIITFSGQKVLTVI